jgi:integrase
MRNLAELAGAWIDSRVSSGVTPVSARSYRFGLLPLCKTLGSKPAATLSLDKLVEYRRLLSETVSAGTAKVRWDLAIAVVRWGQEEGLVPDFRIPRDLRRMRGAPPFRRVWTPAEIQRLVDAADPQMRACILLGANLGYGNRDCARLTKRHINGRIVDAVRHKTGAERRGWLWPETLGALEEWPPPFLNRKGKPLVRDGNDYLRIGFRTLVRRCGIAANGRGFYSLRRAYRTAVDDHWDRPAIDLTMGHITPGMGARYVAWIDDDRLRAVSIHARSKLLGVASERDVVVPPGRAAIA